MIRTRIEWAVKPARSEWMRLGELPRRVGEGRVPDVELAGAVKSRMVGETNGIRMTRRGRLCPCQLPPRSVHEKTPPERGAFLFWWAV